MRELPATRLWAMGIGNTGGGRMAVVPCSSQPGGSVLGVGTVHWEAAWQWDAGPVLAGAKGVTGSSRFPCQLMGAARARGMGSTSNSIKYLC